MQKSDFRYKVIGRSEQILRNINAFGSDVQVTAGTLFVAECPVQIERG
jgi:hypothetical protein